MSSDVARPWRQLTAVLAVAGRRWLAPRTSLFAAALAFHGLLALAPLLLVLLSAAGHLLGQDQARQSLSEAAVRFGGPGGDRVVTSLLNLVTASHWHASGTLVGVALLLYFTSTFFAQLRAAFDSVWEINPKPFGRALFDRVISFGETLLALTCGLLVLVMGALRAIVHPWLERSGTAGAMAWLAWTRLGTLLMIAAMLAATFRYIPSVRPRPRRGAVLAGALPAALALNLMSEVIDSFISRSVVATLYGAAGSVIIFLIWVQYSAWIVLLGAEVCRAWDERAPGLGATPPSATASPDR